MAGTGKALYDYKTAPGSVSVNVGGFAIREGMSDAQVLELVRSLPQSAMPTAPSSEGASMQYKIVTLPNGMKYVQADRQIITGKTPKEQAKNLENFINNEIRHGRDIVIPTEDGDYLKITEDTAWKVGDPNTISAVKANVGTHVDELAAVSKYRRPGKVGDRTGKRFQPDDFEIRRACFRDYSKNGKPGDYYEIEFSVGIDKNGKTFYSIAEPRKRQFHPQRALPPTEALKRDGQLSYINDTTGADESQAGFAYKEAFILPCAVKPFLKNKGGFNIKQIDINISQGVFNPAYYPYLRDKTHRLIFYGGAGSGKSYFIAQRSILKLLESDMCNILCVRRVGETHKTSTFALFKQVISKWKLGEYFKISESTPSVTCTLNGNSVMFKGLDDVEKLKSVTAPKGEITDIWIEEASEIEEDSYNQLELRLRGGRSSKQILISFNPVSVNHWLKKRFFDRKNSATAIIHTTYKDNLFLDDEYRNTLESYKTIDPYYYAVYCLGQWGVYGKTVFNAALVSEQLAKGIQPVKTGYFAYDYDGMVIKNITWVDAPDGYIKIYKEPGKGVPYVIGGDTAGEGSDYFAAHVIDNTDGCQAAVLHHRFDEDLYARQMFCLGRYYNNALISVEVNFSTYPVRELDRMGYTSLYVRRTEDSYTQKLQKSYGFKTTSVTRPVAIAKLVEVMRLSPSLVCDCDTLEEMLTFVRNENGRPEAQQGSHDDLVMALAIAHYSREQQRGDIILPSSAVWSDDMYDDYYKADEETRKIILKKWGNPFEKQ